MGVNGIYGLSGSGMDIESMVKVGMLSKQSEYDKMAQKYTKNEWMKADYLELSNQITTFNASTLSQYKMSTTMNAKSAESSSSAVKVSASSAAANISHAVEVTGLSSNAYLISTGTIERVNSSASSEKSIQLQDILFKSLKKTIDGSGNTLVSGETLSDGSESKTFRKNTLDDKAISFSINDGVTTNTDGSLKEVEISFTFDEVMNGGVTLTDLANKIKNAGLNIKASYDVDNERFSIYNTKSGADNAINITLPTNSTNTGGGRVYSGRVAMNFLNELQLYQSKDGELYDPSTLKDSNTSNDLAFGSNDAATSLKFDSLGSSNGITGTNGTIKIDGVSYVMTDNKKTVNDVTYTAVNRTNGTSAVVTISQDTDAIIDKVKSFVADYNKLLASLYEKYDEKPNSDYKPLTQSQKDSMKEEQITKWEEKAKAGLLYHDQTIGKIIQKMRNAISTGVEQDDGSTASVFSLGISTTGLKGQLVLDEDKLRKALDKDPDIVYNVLSKPDLNVTSKNGVAQKLGDIFTDAVSTIKKRAGSSSDVTEDSDLNNLLRQLQTRMSNFKKMMSTYENALYKKYDAMEATLAKLGTQLNFIMGGNS